MSKIAIVTDSSCDLPNDILEKYNINVLALRVVYSDANEEYRDRVEITPEEIYKRFEEEIPKSSLPLPEDAINLFTKLEAEGYTHVVGIFISSGLSGTYNMVRNVASDFKNLTFGMIDTKSLSMGLGFPVLEGARELEKSGNFEKVVERVKEVSSKTYAFYVVKTLEFLRKGGRIGTIEGKIGDLLKIKPIISINNEGAYYTYRKVRGRKKSISEMYDIAEETVKDKMHNIAIVHGDALEEGKKLMERIKELTNVKEILLTQVSPVLSIHTGPGLIGVLISEA